MLYRHSCLVSLIAIEICCNVYCQASVHMLACTIECLYCSAVAAADALLYCSAAPLTNGCFYNTTHCFISLQCLYEHAVRAMHHVLTSDRSDISLQVYIYSNCLAHNSDKFERAASETAVQNQMQQSREMGTQRPKGAHNSHHNRQHICFQWSAPGLA